LSYDIFVQGFQDGKAVSVTAPRVWELLEAAWEQPPDRLHHALVRRGDAEADLYAGPAGQPIDSLMFSRLVGGAAIFDLIVDVAQAGNMVILPTDAPPCLVDEAQRGDLPADLLEESGAPVLVAGGDELLAVTEAAP